MPRPLITRTNRAPQPARKTTYSSSVDIKTEIRDFLTSRRARITPEDAGLRSYGQRRVPGLRREEVATLAGLSIEYYNRLERGNLGGASETVLHALADALRLDEAERAHLFDLARASQPTSRNRRRARTSNVRPTVQWMLDSMTAAAAFASNGCLDVLSANQLGRALYAPMFRDGPKSANWARFVFLNGGAHELYTDWDRAAKETVALLRLQVGGNPHDRGLTDLIGELATQSDEFRVLWAAHNVRLHTKGVKTLNHPIVGELELHYDRLDLTADQLMLFVYTSEPGSRSAESLNLLASWAASEAEDPARSDPRSRGTRSDPR
jgi:transcriptional regulator with XRE-family HTH domain